MDEIAKLKAQAAKARRFAHSITDRRTQDVLEEFARECEAKVREMTEDARDRATDADGASPHA